MKSSASAWLCLLLLVGVLDGAAFRRIHLHRGRTSAEIIGHFTTKVTDTFFIVRAAKGQHMRIEIRPLTANLVTAGTVDSPSGKSDGGPGGIIFNSDLTESGDYRIHVFERQQNLPGEFVLQIDIT